MCDDWRGCLHAQMSWDLYVLWTALWTGWSVAIGSAAFQYQLSPPVLPTVPVVSPLSIPYCSDATSLSKWLLTVGCLHLLVLALLTSLRSGRGSLQLRAVFIATAVQGGSLLLSLLAVLALNVVLAVSLSSYSASASPYCPSAPGSFLYVTAALAIPFSFLTVFFSLYRLLSLVYHRLVFAHPPVKSISSTQEADAITWIRARTGDIIPTLLIVPPTVDVSQTSPGHFPCHTVLLYSHANATDLEDSVFVLRALAETFDCGVLGYDWPGYGLCGGRASEDGCYAAIEAAYTCLIDYHHCRPKQIILYGRSLGTGPSTHLAHLLRSQVGGLVLQSPMQSVLRAGCPCVSAVLPWDIFRSCDRVGELTLPTLIMHGEKDTVVPFSHAVQLEGQLKAEAAFPPLWVPDGDHQRNMPKPWLYSTERGEADSDARYEEKMQINQRNAVYITRMRQFIHHCHQRALEAEEQQKAPASPLTVDTSLPVLSIPAQKALLEQLSSTPAAVRVADEEKVADGLFSPVLTTRHAIFALSDERKTSEAPMSTLSPPLSTSHFPSSRPPSQPGSGKAVSAPGSAVVSPRPLMPLSPLSSGGPPPLIALPSSLPLFGVPSPQYPLPALGDDDSPPRHVRTHSATAALRASSRITSYPHSRHRPRRSITVNTVERPHASGTTGGSLNLEALLGDAGMREIRLVRDREGGGEWRVDRSGGGEEDVGTQTQGSSGPGPRRPRRSLSHSPPEQSTSLESLQLRIAVREEERKEE